MAVPFLNHNFTHIFTLHPSPLSCLNPCSRLLSSPLPPLRKALRLAFQRLDKLSPLGRISPSSSTAPYVLAFRAFPSRCASLSRVVFSSTSQYFPVDSQEVAVVIGLQSCQDSPCQSTSSDLGIILYNGPYDPESYKVAYEYENITVAVPSDTSTGTAVLGVLHVSVVGVS